MPYKSKAQQGFMHAAEERGEMSPKVVKEFDEATTGRQYARLPEHVKHAVGGFIHHLVKHYFGGGEAGRHHQGSEHDERRGSYADPDGHDSCAHYAHGGESEEHSPGCPRGVDHDEPSYAEGGEAREAEYRLQGADWQRERNAPRSPLAEHLVGARMRKNALSQILRRPATRVP